MAKKKSSPVVGCLVLLVIVYMPFAALKSCLAPDDSAPASSVTSLRATPTRTPTPTSTYEPWSPEPEPTIDYTAETDSTPEDLPDVNVPNPNLPGHRPHVHIGHHGGHLHW